MNPAPLLRKACASAGLLLLSAPLSAAVLTNVLARWPSDFVVCAEEYVEQHGTATNAAFAALAKRGESTGDKLVAAVFAPKIEFAPAGRFVDLILTPKLARRDKETFTNTMKRLEPETLLKAELRRRVADEDWADFLLRYVLGVGIEKPRVNAASFVQKTGFVRKGDLLLEIVSLRPEVLDPLNAVRQRPPRAPVAVSVSWKPGLGSNLAPYLAGKWMESKAFPWRADATNLPMVHIQVDSAVEQNLSGLGDLMPRGFKSARILGTATCRDGEAKLIGIETFSNPGMALNVEAALGKAIDDFVEKKQAEILAPLVKDCQIRERAWVEARLPPLP